MRNLKYLRYIIFFSILGGVFIQVYRKSDKKGLHNLWTCIKTTFVIAGTIAGIFPISWRAAAASEPLRNQSQPEKIISNQEFDLFEVEIIEVKGGGGSTPTAPIHGPSRFPGSAGRPQQFVGGSIGPKPYVYRPTPKIVKQDRNRVRPDNEERPQSAASAAAAAVNPGGEGDGGYDSDFEDQCSVPDDKKEEQPQQDPFDEISQSKKKQKVEAEEECKLDEESIDKEVNQTEKASKSIEVTSKLDKNGNPDYTIKRKSGTEVVVSYDQALKKYYHHDVYEIEAPTGFNNTKARSLKPDKRLEYLQNVVPKDKVIEFQKANIESLKSPNIMEVPGFIGPRKEPGTLFIDRESYQIHFTTDTTNQWRTTVTTTRSGLNKLALNDFHLFPNAGNNLDEL